VTATTYTALAAQCATSMHSSHWMPWDQDKKDLWVRPLPENAVTEANNHLPWFTKGMWDYELQDRFGAWYHKKQGAKKTACLVGIRTDESLNRFRTIVKANKSMWGGKRWTTRVTENCYNVYPIYDWTFEDIWTYIGNESVPYNKVYDWMYVKGFRIPSIRVSNLIHENAFGCLTTLHEFEPETYDRLVARCKGIHVAARYADEQTVFSAKKLPNAFKDWLEYREFLLSTLPEEVRTPFVERFATQKQTTPTLKQQVKQVLTNDWENFVPVKQMDDRPDTREKWMEIL
jgi:predicted phosphoadenosine phosphosulfate sulfurtransferase